METKHPDEEKRNKIPLIENLATRYRPVGNYLMIVPLPDLEKIGRIHLPQTARMTYNEGHIVAVGQTVPVHFEIGDCVSWSEHTEVGVEADDKTKFCLVQAQNIILQIKRADLQ